MYRPSWPKISTESENAVSAFLHFQTVKRLKMEGHPVRTGNTELISISLGLIASAIMSGIFTVVSNRAGMTGGNNTNADFLYAELSA